jgi:glycosyltransferase involved in cell wall biosynthesis
MRRRIMFGWCLGVCVVTYPVGVLLLLAAAELVTFQPSAADWFSSSFVLAQLVALMALPRGGSPYGAEGLGRIVAGIATWAVAGHALWLSALFFFGAADSIDRALLIFTAGTQVMLTSLGYALFPPFHGLLAVAGAAILACLPLLALYYPDLLTSQPGVESLFVVGTFLLINGLTYLAFVKRRDVSFAEPVRLVVSMTQWVVAAQLGWVATLLIIGMSASLPRHLPLVIGLVAWVTAVGIPVGFLFATRRLTLDMILKLPTSREDPNMQITLEAGAATGRRTAWIISYTGVSNEPRVLRQSRALLDDGWRVVVCGHDGHSPRPREWTYVRLPTADPYRPQFALILAALRSAGRVVAVYGWPSGFARLGARLHHLSVPRWRYFRHSVLDLAAENPHLKPDLILCNDYFTCDVGYALARHYGAKFVVDCHEYAVEQNAHDARWVKWTRPLVLQVQDYYLTRADIVSTVCDGIADLLNKDHALKRPALVVRSVPTKQIQAFRPTGDRISVLYHGGIWHVRQLHAAIESMPLWRPEFDLVLRGDGDPSYIAELRRLAHRYGLDKRVFFEPAVEFEQIIPAANRADIGYFSYANFSRQSQFVLPNKFFEYVMAGLAVCVIDLTEMGRLTRKYDLGKCIPVHKPEAIAAAINSFTRAEIDRCKRNALQAAEELNWDREREAMVAAYNELYGERAAGPAPVLVGAGAAAAPC